MAQPVENPEVGQQYWLTWWLTTGKTPHALFQVWKVQVLYIDVDHVDNVRGAPCVCAPVDPAGFIQGNSVDARTNDLFATREEALENVKDKFNKAWDELAAKNDEMKNLGDGSRVNMAAAFL